VSPRKLASILLTSAAVSVITLGPRAAVATTMADAHPYAFQAWAPCANANLGELIDVDGTMRIVAHESRTTGATFVVLTYSGTGVGEVSGDVYSSSIAAKVQSHVGSTTVTSGHDSFVLAGHGDAVTMHVRIRVHTTVLPSGAVTVSLSSTVATCRSS
jgi:hypothetical protein